MTDIAQLGNRIELVSMDKHFHDITLGLYEQPSADGVPEYIVHSYAGYDGTADRIQFVMRAMQLIGGMEITPGERLSFVCGDAHRAACRRLFIEASKLAGDAPPEARPLSISSICAMRRFTLASVKFLSRLFTALNLAPSIATLASLNRSSWRHKATN